MNVIGQQNVFKIGQIVWAKVRGFAWWPAVVNILISI